MVRLVSHGIVGFAAYLPISIRGGARSAEEVTVHRIVTAMKAAALAGAMNGSSRKAAQETRVIAAAQVPIRPSTFDTRSAQTPVAKSATMNTAWSSIRMKMTALAGMPADFARAGR